MTHISIKVIFIGRRNKMKLISLLYNKINWQNSPSTSTPINAMNLGKMDKGIDDITKALTDNNVSFNFGYDGTDYGYYKNGESILTPFRSRHTGTYKPTSRASNNDMGLYHTNRYVDTTSIPNANSETYTVNSNGLKDMGLTNNNRFVSVNVVNTLNSSDIQALRNETSFSCQVGDIFVFSNVLSFNPANYVNMEILKYETVGTQQQVSTVVCRALSTSITIRLNAVSTSTGTAALRIYRT